MSEPAPVPVVDDRKLDPTEQAIAELRAASDQLLGFAEALTAASNQVGITAVLLRNSAERLQATIPAPLEESWWWRFRWWG